MDVLPDNPPPPSSQTEESAAAWLVVHNGRLRGARRPLSASLTLLGRAAACDIRLNADGIADLQCVLALGPGGLIVRDLGSGSTLVNGQPVTTQPLAHADLLTVGPLLFMVELAATPPQAEEHTALRIQAAAVVAQQAALTEEEQALHQRQSALENQEQQLAAHLEQRRQRLVELQEQFRTEKANWRQQCAVVAEQQADVEKRLVTLRTEAEEENALARDRRQRVDQLRRRLIQRYRRDWSAKEAELARRENDLAAGRARLAKDAEGLQNQRAALHEARLRLNGEVELGHRQLSQEWEELGLAQTRWEACLDQEQRALARRQEEAKAQLAGAAQALQARTEENVGLARTRDALLGECAGLETRIRNVRQQLHDQERALANLERARVPTAPSSLTLTLRPPLPLGSLVNVAQPSQEGSDLATALARVSAQLTDQRAHLMEQWHHLVVCHHAFHEERLAALAEADAVAQRLAQRENALYAREEALETERNRLAERQEFLLRQRSTLEAWQSRLTVQATEAQARTAALQDEARAGSKAAQALVRRQKRLRRRQVRRWSAEVEALRTARLLAEEGRRQYLALLEVLNTQQTELAERQQEHAAETLALEQLRQEMLGRSTPGSEKRLEQLRRQIRTLAESTDANRDRHVRALAAETTRLEEQTRSLKRTEERLLGRQRKVAEQQTLQDANREKDAAIREQLSCQLQSLQAQHAADELRLTVLHEEIERLASILLDEVRPDQQVHAPRATQAA